MFTGRASHSCTSSRPTSAPPAARPLRNWLSASGLRAMSLRPSSAAACGPLPPPTGTDARGGTSTDVAERIWVACNVPPDELGGRLRTIATAYRHRGLRSLSTGDAVILTGDKARVALSVARAGWSLIPGELTIVTPSQHGTVPWLADRWPAAVWMLHRWDRHDDETTPHPAEEDALQIGRAP